MGESLLRASHSKTQCTVSHEVLRLMGFHDVDDDEYVPYNALITCIDNLICSLSCSFPAAPTIQCCTMTVPDI